MATARALSMSIDETEDIAQNVILTLDGLKKTWMAKLNDNCLFISAKTRLTLKNRETLCIRQCANCTY